MMKFKLGVITAIMSGLLVACGGDGNGAGTDATPVNKSPVANADFFNTVQGTSLSLDVLANDIDPELGALSIKSSALAIATQGSLSISSDKKLLNLAPSADFVGDIVLSYTVIDAQGNQTIGQATVSVKSLQSLSAKQDSTCVVTSTGLVKCWGGNDYGQLGEGVALNATNTFKTTPVTVANLNGVKQVAMGYTHACAITQTGAVSCWGDNNKGQLGDGTQTQRLQATPVLGLAAKATQLALSYDSSCALLETGLVQCWGSNSQGELAIPSTTVFSASPKTLTIGSNLKAKRLVAGNHHVCAISENNSLFCWGANDNGQLGINDKVRRYQATQVTVTGSVQQVAAGFAHTCAANGTNVYCWGINDKGQLGISNTTDAISPMLVTNLSGGVSSLALGKDHSCAVTTDNKTYCWGSRYAGQTAQTVDSTALDTQATQVSSLAGKRELSAGDFHTCSIEGAGLVKCWGKNDLGQLANGSSAAQSATAVSVTFN